MKKIALIINGKSGTGSLQNTTFQIIENLAMDGNEITVFPIDPEKHLFPDEQIKEKGNQYDLIVCAGGDGTLNHLINNLMPLENRPTIGYIPAGSTNDFAKSLSLPTNVDQACQIIREGQVFAYDIGQLNQQYFNYIAAFGAFSSVSYSTEQSIKNIFGHAAYILSAISEFPQQMNQKCHMKITTDTISIEDDFLFGAIFSTHSIGGIDISNLSHGSLNDGKYELLLIRYPENLKDLGQVIQALLENNLNNPYIVYENITQATIESNEIAWSVDGEFGGTSNTATFAVHPKAISIMIPKK